MEIFRSLCRQENEKIKHVEYLFVLLTLSFSVCEVTKIVNYVNLLLAVSETVLLRLRTSQNTLHM
jgi:hypothetical protein